ncbi:NADH dehydrogenase [ubiquinone] 1 alpha subcomplex assembly factor 2 isoform X2 [Lagenorhynchus albirostris]|uniref:NADH dehydrogenase [ubiquinone] 1 alpha subcomplex assembly factor 2 isoform X2 n=1 Tax=Lagenorhynchus albirostris TaxID=27610 RepID=UPI0028E34C9D|nr:NADH dehydrogenase [ubiquinone] 1 alpha subcomplex assembly factor 2 isoform X2 [Lagenorhynchus albirostris]
MGWSQNLFRVLWRALSKEVKEQVGTDLFGNKYYYIPEYKNWRGCGRAGPGAMAHGPSPSAACGILPDRGTKPRPLHRQADSQPLRHQGSPLLMLLRQTIREKRIVESANKREIDYEVGDIPAEWEAWIRKTRKTPPTMEEGRCLDTLWRCVDWRAPFELRVTYPSTSP